jgi:hypothetical protein
LRGERLALYDRECQTTPLALAKEMHMDIPALTGHEVKDPGAVAIRLNVVIKELNRLSRLNPPAQPTSTSDPAGSDE